jgi:hypothetical protein
MKHPRLPDPASPTVAIAVNVICCVIELGIVAVAAWLDQEAMVVFAAIGAGVSITAAAWVRAKEARDTLIREKLQADIAGARFMAAIAEHQHDAMVRAEQRYNALQADAERRH